MAGKAKKTKAQVLEAIRGSGGLRSAIMARLGVTAYATLRAYLERWPEAREELEQEEERCLDEAENKLLELIRSGSLGAIMYYLNNKGKRRGYSWNSRDGQRPEEKNGNAGVLVAPGMLGDDEWEKAAQKGGK